MKIISNLSADSGSLKYIGKIGVLGSVGSGKTKFIKLITNLANKRILHNYEESEEINGTLKSQPYSIPLNNNKILLVDNPGQNSLESLRKTVALSGDSYKGLLLFLDATNVNFWEIGLNQCEAIKTTINNPTIPIMVIVTKFDLNRILLGSKSFVDELSLLIEKIVSSITKESGKKLPYFNKKLSKVEYINFDSDNFKSIPFTQLEQFIVNGLDQHFNVNPLIGITQINVRLFVRSILLGFCTLFKRYTMLQDFKNNYPEINIPDGVQFSLSNFRPTAFETKSSWNRMSNNENEKEPQLALDYFKFANISSIIKRDVILNSDTQIEDFILEAKSKFNIKSFFIHNINKRETLEIILEAISDFSNSTEFQNSVSNIQQSSKKDVLLKKSTFNAIKPPPKPSRKNWKN